MKFLTLDQAIRDICGIGGLDAGTKYIPMARNVRLALNEMNMSLLPSVGSGRYTVLDNLSVSMPDDCIEVLKVGYVSGDSICIMHRKEIPESTGCSCETEVVAEECTYCNFFGYNYAYDSVYYGLKRKPVQQFYDFDPKTSLLSLEGVSAGKTVYVTYKSCLSEDTYSAIPSEVMPVLTYRALETYSVSKSELAKASYYRNLLRGAVNDYKTFKSPTIEEMYDSLVGNYQNGAR